MAQSPSWEANWFAASQEIPRISRNPKVNIVAILSIYRKRGMDKVSKNLGATS